MFHTQRWLTSLTCCLLVLFTTAPSAFAKDKKDDTEDIGKISLITQSTACPVTISKIETGYRETSKEVSQERGGNLFGGGSVNTFQRPKGFENKIFLKNQDSTRLTTGVEVTAIYFSVFGEYINTIAFYCRRPLDAGGKDRELKGNVDFPGAGYASHIILYVSRVALDDGSTWNPDLVALQGDIATQAGVTLTQDQLQPGFKTDPQGHDPVRNYLVEPIMLSE